MKYNPMSIATIGEALGFYVVTFRCGNCRLEQLIEIPRGTPVRDFVPGLCPGCGCDALATDPASGIRPHGGLVSSSDIQCRCPKGFSSHPHPYR